MTEQVKLDPIQVFEKINVRDIDFDNITDEELHEIKEEIEVIMKIRQLKNERLEQIKKQINDEKEILIKIMLKEVKKEKQRLREEEEDYEESSESIVYDKKSPKGRVTKAKSRGRPAAKKK